MRDRIRRGVVTLLVAAATAYIVALLCLFLLQTRLIFPAGSVGPAPPKPAGSETLSLHVDGAMLRGIHIAPLRSASKDRRVIIGFGGNGWNGEAAAATLHHLYPGSDVVVFHFRGYRPSSGTPSAAALLADAPIIHDLVAARFPGRPVVVVGFSIGTALAIRMARERPVVGLILVTPFDSLGRVTAAHYPWVPVRLLLRHRLEPVEDLKFVTAPVAVIAAARDEVFPQSRTEALRAAIRNKAYDRTIERSGHNDIYRMPAFDRSMKEAWLSL